MLSTAEARPKPSQEAGEANDNDSWYQANSDSDEEGGKDLESLQNEYNKQSWNRRLFFPPEGHHPWHSLSHQNIVKEGSQLRHELHPDEIIETEKPSDAIPWGWSSDLFVLESRIEDLTTTVSEGFEAMSFDSVEEDPDEAISILSKGKDNEDLQKRPSTARSFVARALASRPLPYRFRKPRGTYQTKKVDRMSGKSKETVRQERG